MLRFEPNGHRREVDFGPPPVAARAFHLRLPGYAPGPLRALPGIAAELGLGKLWLKDESERFGLPAFKPLGASWACYRVCVERLGFEPAWTTLEELREAVAPLRPLAFVTDRWQPWKGGCASSPLAWVRSAHFRAEGNGGGTHLGDRIRRRDGHGRRWQLRRCGDSGSGRGGRARAGHLRHLLAGVYAGPVVDYRGLRNDLRGG